MRNLDDPKIFGRKYKAMILECITKDETFSINNSYFLIATVMFTSPEHMIKIIKQ